MVSEQIRTWHDLTFSLGHVRRGEIDNGILTGYMFSEDEEGLVPRPNAKLCGLQGIEVAVCSRKWQGREHPTDEYVRLSSVFGKT